ncbi:MAG: hypothetical protein NW201_14335 [Gemmatimonadales bacterium]|nr:hypothetical protein [Gemmatimonadales bacterium]
MRRLALASLALAALTLPLAAQGGGPLRTPDMQYRYDYPLTLAKARAWLKLYQRDSPVRADTSMRNAILRADRIVEQGSNVLPSQGVRLDRHPKLGPLLKQAGLSGAEYLAMPEIMANARVGYRVELEGKTYDRQLINPAHVALYKANAAEFEAAVNKLRGAPAPPRVGSPRPDAELPR